MAGPPQNNDTDKKTEKYCCYRFTSANDTPISFEDIDDIAGSFGAISPTVVTGSPFGLIYE